MPEDSNESLPQRGDDYESQKRSYFTAIGLHVRPALQFHKHNGLWERNEQGKRDWGNVSEHCIVEAARARELAKLLDLPEDVSEDLETAAALHDFYKLQEKAIVESEGLRWESFEKSDAQAKEQLQAGGFSERVIRLAGAIGHGSLEEAEHILTKDLLDDDDLAFLAMHYIDDYTVGSDEALPARAEDGSLVNSLNDRIKKNMANPRYAALNEDGRGRFGGLTTFEAQEKIGSQAEALLASRISQKQGRAIESKQLPSLIDGLIHHEILKTVQPTDSQVSESAES